MLQIWRLKFLLKIQHMSTLTISPYILESRAWCRVDKRGCLRLIEDIQGIQPRPSKKEVVEQVVRSQCDLQRDMCWKCSMETWGEVWKADLQSHSIGLVPILLSLHSHHHWAISFVSLPAIMMMYGVDCCRARKLWTEDPRNQKPKCNFSPGKLLMSSILS